MFEIHKTIWRDIEEANKIISTLNENSLEYWKFVLLKRQLQIEYNKYTKELERIKK